MNRLKMMKISDFAEVVTGGTPSTKKKEYWENGTIPWLPSGACQDVRIKSAEKFISALGLDNSSAKLMPKNTVVIALTGATTGKLGILDIEATANQSVTGILPNNNFIPEYLYFYLMSIRKKIIFDSYGGAQKHISQGYVKNMEVPLPNIEIQKQISDSLLLSQSLIEKRKAQLEEYDRLIESVFFEMFGDISLNSGEWSIYPIDNVITSIIAGWSVSGEERKKERDEVAVLKISAVTSGTFNANEYKVIDKSKEIKKSIYPEKGDIIFSRANTRELVGASAIVNEDHFDLILPDKLWKVNIDKEKVTTEYFKAIISNKYIRHEFSKNATGTSGSMLNISMKKFKEVNIPVPPLENQKEFSVFIKEIFNQKLLLEKSLCELENNFKSILQSAFIGLLN